MSDSSHSDRNPRPPGPQNRRSGGASDAPPAGRRKTYRQFGPATPAGAPDPQAQNAGRTTSGAGRSRPPARQPNQQQPDGAGRRRGNSRPPSARGQTTNPRVLASPTGGERAPAGAQSAPGGQSRPPRDRGNAPSGGKRVSGGRTTPASAPNQTRKDAPQGRNPNPARPAPSGTRAASGGRPQQGARPQQRVRPARERVWDPSRIQAEETYDDIRRDNERIEKEIWLEIAGIHTLTLD